MNCKTCGGELTAGGCSRCMKERLESLGNAQLTYNSSTAFTLDPLERCYWLRVFAGQAMQGMIANPVTKKWWRKDGKDYLDETIAGTAVRCAKVLLDAIEDYEKEAAGE